MTLSDLQEMSVIQLRKYAREHQIILSAGINKSAMVSRIAEALRIVPAPLQDDLSLPVSDAAPASSSDEGQSAPLFSSADDPEPVSGDLFAEIAEELSDSSAESAPAQEEKQIPESTEKAAESGSPRFQAAWHSTDAPSHSVMHASYASTGTGRPAWQNTTPSGRPLSQDQRPQPLRPHTFGPRFGPASANRPESSSSDPARGMSPERPDRPDRPDRPVRPAVSPLPDHRIGFTGSGTAFGPGSSSSFSSSVSSVSLDSQDSSLLNESAYGSSESSSLTLEELLSAGNFEEGGGILELHPDGYGFLRASGFMPSSKDIYVSMAQIRRFGLRTGDDVRGKIRPQREGDKFAALLYIDTINGKTEEENSQRPVFEELTPVYPFRRMSLDVKANPDLKDMRLIDLIAPLGFGQRGLLLCPPEAGKRELLSHYANAIAANYPDVHVLVLLIDPNPEDVTLFRESVSCPVLASTFDLAPEAHLRLTEVVIERAMRLAEQQKDVVILADSLTRLAKIYSTSAVQQGRSVPGMVNPASLLRAKRMFGAARALKEGGSLTVIAAMDIASGNKVDDSVVEEFKGTANMELMLDASLARAGIRPPVQLQRSFTKNADILLDSRQKEGLELIRQMLGSTPSSVAVPQLLSMMEKAPTNADLLLKMKDWFALMNRT